MDREIFDGTMRTFKHRTPVRPFTVSRVNGQRLEVNRPDAIAVSDGVALFVGPGGVPAVFDYEWVAQMVENVANRPV